LNENLEHIISTDIKGSSLHGENTYLLHLPPGIPACNFWSVIVYDIETGLMINTDQSWPSVHSNCKKIFVNTDGSVDIAFGPKIKDSKEHNWIKTIPGKRWKMILRLYGLTEAKPEKKWNPGKLELIK